MSALRKGTRVEFKKTVRYMGGRRVPKGTVASIYKTGVYGPGPGKKAFILRGGHYFVVRRGDVKVVK